MLNRRGFLVVLAPGMVLLSGCASGGGGSGGRRRGGSGVLTEEDLAPYPQESLHDTIRRARASWLRRRGGSERVEVVQVYVDGARLGDISTLQSIRTSEVARVEYMNGGDATTRFGTGHGGGVIQVTMRR